MTRSAIDRHVALAARSLICASLFVAMTMSCVRGSPQMGHNMIDKDAYEITKPLHLGMKRERVMELADRSESAAFVLGSANMAMGKRVYFANDAVLGVVFDNSDRISYICCHDERRRYLGVGIGSTFKKVREICKDASAIPVPGLGCYVQAGPIVWFVFDSEECPPAPDTRVVSVEVRRELR